VGRQHLGVGLVAITVANGLLVYWVATAPTSLAWTALAIVSVALAFLFATAVSRRDRRPTGPPIRRAPSPGDGVYRVLIIVDAGATLASIRRALEKLPDAAAGQPAEALVVAPTLSARLDRWTRDRSAYDEAAIRLHEIITALDALGIKAQGRLGPSEPLLAIETGLREFAAEWIILVTVPDARSNWLESGVLASATGRTDVPISHIVVDDAVLD
jgi:hypothetical protein